MKKQTYKKYHSLPIKQYAEFIALSIKIMPEDKRKAFLARARKNTPVPVNFKFY